MSVFDKTGIEWLNPVIVSLWAFESVIVTRNCMPPPKVRVHEQRLVLRVVDHDVFRQPALAAQASDPEGGVKSR
ncbi:MAG: hypothetical protein WD072_07405 [Pirellulales bacterium]